MGYRTVVVLNNDTASNWSDDPLLGRHIRNAMHEKRSFSNYGKVIECEHADTNTLMVLNSLNGTALAHTLWHQGQTDEGAAVALLMQAAQKLGYRLTKIPAKVKA